MIHHTISVPLGERAYPIYLGSDTLGEIGQYCAKHGIPKRVVVVADRNSARAALRPAMKSLRAAGFDAASIIIPPGERQKSIARAEAIHAAMLRLHVPRNAALMALGGGVVGDVAGFVASTYRRGLPFVQCPTTLLSQVDSSIGGKNGVNHPLSKNAIGTFHQPVFVFSDVALLRTLPRREVIAGLGETLKYPIVADPPLLEFIEQRLDSLLGLETEAVLEVASRCLRVKAGLVGEDEQERLTDRGRVFLNVGHAVGHALETLSHYALRHGEAVLLGILAEGWIAVQHEGFPHTELDRLVHLYKRLNLHYRLSRIRDGAVIKSVMGRGHARFVLPRSLGDVRVVSDVTEKEVADGLRFMRSV